MDLLYYRKYNCDLKDLSDEELHNHYEKIGKFQMRIYNELPFFKKEVVIIFSIRCGYYIANALKYILFKNFILSNIVYEINPHSDHLHIIPFCQKVKIFPKKYIIYQLEQKDISKWIDKKYETAIANSMVTWDYSKANINKFSMELQKKIIYYPIPIVPYPFWKNNIYFDQNNSNNSKICENNKSKNNILFYGILNESRKKKLYTLQKMLLPKYHIRILSNSYGEKLFDEIMQSKIIINIHFYENALLETYRINEVLSCRKIVISEKPNSDDVDNYNLYKDKVLFVDTIQQMYYNIVYILDNNIDSNFQCDKVIDFTNNVDFANLVP
jgi:hypothetical protein